MAKFVNTSDFLELNIGFALDEGMADPSEQFPLFYGERSIWRKYKLFTPEFLVFFYE
jgi:aminoacylase